MPCDYVILGPSPLATDLDQFLMEHTSVEHDDLHIPEVQNLMSSLVSNLLFFMHPLVNKIAFLPPSGPSSKKLGNHLGSSSLCFPFSHQALSL